MTTTTTTTTTGVPGATPRACLAIAAVALALRLGLALRDVVALDRMFVPDDTYYTLTIARSIARGLGPTVDGTHLTSGFQPLLAFLLAPVLKLGATPEGGFRAALALGGVADSASAWLLGFLAYRIGRGSKVAAILATTLWALSPSAIATSLNGLETSLAVASVLAALAAWTALRERDRPLGWLGCGMLLGLALFARVDTVFFVALVGLATLRTGGAAGLRRAAIAAGGALVVVGPWWAYSLARFGTIVPESGAAVREQTRMYAAMGMVLRDQLAWAAGAVVGPPLFDSTWLRQALGSGASGVGCAIAVVLVAGAFVLARWARRSAERTPLEILAIASATLFLFYAVYLPATWFFRRYLVPVHVLVALLIAVFAAHAWSTRAAHRWRARGTVLVLGGAALAALATIARFAIAAPSITVDQGHHGAKGYREPTQQILALAPPGAVIGSFQSGALGWFADGSGRSVVNLDGVVDVEAARAVRERTIASFARSRGVTHLADWDVNVRLFLARSGDPSLLRAALRPVGEAELQGRDERFVLYEIEWSSDAARPSTNDAR